MPSQKHDRENMGVSALEGKNILGKPQVICDLIFGDFSDRVFVLQASDMYVHLVLANFHNNDNCREKKKHDSAWISKSFDDDNLSHF